MHQNICPSSVQEPTSSEESPRPKPKQKLRDNFEATVEQQETRVHKTWDLESDLSTRSLNMRNIIERHETITAEESPKPEKKLTGILKKTSSSNILLTDTRAEKTTHGMQKRFYKVTVIYGYVILYMNLFIHIHKSSIDINVHAVPLQPSPLTTSWTPLRRTRSPSSPRSSTSELKKTASSKQGNQWRS